LEVAGEGLEVLLFERTATVEYLPGTVPILLGRSSRERWSATLSLDGVRVVAGEVEEVSGDAVKSGGQGYGVDAAICAPGLVPDGSRVPEAPNVHALWDPAGAEAARDATIGFPGGTVAVVVSALPYRCPPAPFGLAMELAALYREDGRRARVVLTTPEETPLAAVGGGVPEFLARSCTDAGVELLAGFVPDLDSLADGELRSASGGSLRFDLALVVPPHARSALLAGLPGDGPLVPVSPGFESLEPGLFVVGDAAMAPLPRAADVAAAGGRTAADAALVRLGLAPERGPHLPEPECYVGHGGGAFSRISIRYPDGLPPAGSPEVSIEGPSEDLAESLDNSFRRWLALREAG
jgi:sulfide:quinone oxidoreductase